MAVQWIKQMVNTFWMSKSQSTQENIISTQGKNLNIFIIQEKRLLSSSFPLSLPSTFWCFKWACKKVWIDEMSPFMINTDGPLEIYYRLCSIPKSRILLNLLASKGEKFSASFRIFFTSLLTNHQNSRMPECNFLFNASYSVLGWPTASTTQEKNFHHKRKQNSFERNRWEVASVFQKGKKQILSSFPWRYPH